jgi:hypothetical protein
MGLMSKGHGDVQRILLDILDASEDLTDTFGLAALVYHADPTANTNRIELSDAEVNSVRRALGRLVAEQCIVGIRSGWRDKRARWCTHRVYDVYQRKLRAAFGERAVKEHRAKAKGLRA